MMLINKPSHDQRLKAGQLRVASASMLCLLRISMSPRQSGALTWYKHRVSNRKIVSRVDLFSQWLRQEFLRDFHRRNIFSNDVEMVGCVP